MASKGQMTGMRGVYLVAAELSRLGFIVSPTSRSANGADLLVTDQLCKRAYSVQIKTSSRPDGFWLIGKNARNSTSASHIYVLVKIRNTKREGETIQYYAVPSKKLAQLAHHEGNWPNVREDRLTQYKSKWSVFGPPSPERDAAP